MDAEPLLDDVVVVVVGSFNPAIFHPAWIAAQGLVPLQEAEQAEVSLIASSIAQFRCGAVTLEVTQQRLVASTSERASVLVMRDLVVGILSVLEHTPVSKCGINRLMHFGVSSEEVWHRIGHAVVPKSIFAGCIDEAGTRSVTIEGRRPGSSARYMRVKIEPSLRVRPGVFFDFNEHFEQPDGATSARFAREVLMQDFDAAQAHFSLTARTVLERTGRPA